MYIEYLPQALLEDIVNNKCIPFIGAGFTKNAVCDPSIDILDWNGLGKKTASYFQDYEYESAIEALSHYENEYSRANLVEMIAKELHINEISPGECHLNFCKLYFDIICTTNFDYLLETTFGELYAKKGKPYHVVASENRLSTYLNEKTTIIKMHGDFNEPNRMVITENDYDTFISQNPLLCTYIANLLITRTPLLIGYSLNDPDIRMIWNIISSRLNTLRRTGYVIMVSASNNDISRFKRRGINVINLPGKKSDYSHIYSELFKELLDFWNTKNLANMKTSNEDAISILKFPKDELGRLCFFSVPYQKLSLYKKNIFPIVERQGLVPVSVDEFILPGENIGAKINTLINKSDVAIIDITNISGSIKMELGLINEFNKPHLIISDKSSASSDISVTNVLVGDFNNDLEHLLCGIEDFLYEYVMNTNINNDYKKEPQRLFSLKEYNASIISAIRLLEIELSKYWMRKNQSESSTAIIPISQLVKLIDKKEIDTEKIKEWSSIRNQVVHTQFISSRKQAKLIIDGVNNMITNLD